ncbi:MAG TPA: hypothetical protein VL494_13610 [Steroidobacteraceae bacterium]|jgi:hypothetical protein|nr:hypothetical protein [Steroidobacteraceae bacterium]
MGKADTATQRTCDKRRRSKAPKPAERVIRIKRMMSEGLWQEGVSDHELAEEWKCDVSTVRHSSAEASRAILSQVQDATFAGRMLTVLLDNITNARNARRYEAVVRSVEVALRIVGIDANKPPPPDANTTRPAEIVFVEAKALPETAGG